MPSFLQVLLFLPVERRRELVELGVAASLPVMRIILPVRHQLLHISRDQHTAWVLDGESAAGTSRATAKVICSEAI
jgi:hypothetical protein